MKLPAAMALMLALLPAAAVRAVYECGGETDTCNCGADNPCLCDGTCGNCVWHAWHMACCSWGRALEWCTDAGTWDGFAWTGTAWTGTEVEAETRTRPAREAAAAARARPMGRPSPCGVSCFSC